jgi:signal transduction histidine kinase
MNNGPTVVPAWLAAHLRQALAHELPNRLVAIRGLLRLLELEEADRLSGDGRDQVRRLEAAAERTHALVLALADLVQALVSAEAPQEVPLASLVQEVAAELKQAHGEQTPALTYDILVPSVTVPPRQLRRVLVELMRQVSHSNLVNRAEVTIRAQEITAGIEILVESRGGCLSPDQLGRLFEPFAGEGSDHRLGLVLARALVERWGGSLTVHGEPECRTVFTVFLPGLEAGTPGRESL